MVDVLVFDEQQLQRWQPVAAAFGIRWRVQCLVAVVCTHGTRAQTLRGLLLRCCLGRSTQYVATNHRFRSILCFRHRL